MISFQIQPWVAVGLPYLLIQLFYIGIPVVRTDGRSLAGSVYGHVITKFSGMGRLPHFLSYGAPPTRAPRARVELRYKLSLKKTTPSTNLMCLAQQASPASYGSVYNIFTKYPLPNLMSTALEEYHLELQLVLILVLFSFILIFCLKKKYIFCFSVSFWFFILSLIFKVYCPWFLKWRFWLSKWDKYMDLTHVTASVVGGQQYPRPGHSDIYHGQTRQRGCVRRKLP